MAPTDEDEEVLFEQFRRPPRQNGNSQKASLASSTADAVVSDDSDEDEDVIFDQMQLLPNHTTRHTAFNELEKSKVSRILKTVLICLSFCGLVSSLSMIFSICLSSEILTAQVEFENLRS